MIALFPLISTVSSKRPNLSIRIARCCGSVGFPLNRDINALLLAVEAIVDSYVFSCRLRTVLLIFEAVILGNRFA